MWWREHHELHYTIHHLHTHTHTHTQSKEKRTACCTSAIAPNVIKGAAEAAAAAAVDGGDNDDITDVFD